MYGGGGEIVAQKRILFFSRNKARTILVMINCLFIEIHLQ